MSWRKKERQRARKERSKHYRGIFEDSVAAGLQTGSWSRKDGNEEAGLLGSLTLRRWEAIDDGVNRCEYRKSFPGSRNVGWEAILSRGSARAKCRSQSPN